MAILFSVLAVMGCALIFLGLRQRRDEQSALLAILDQPVSAATIDVVEQQRPASERLLKPLLQALAGRMRFLRVFKGVDQRIDAAGLARKMTVEDFYSYAILAALVTALLLALLSSQLTEFNWMIAAGVGLLIGFYLPMLILSSKAKSRRAAMRKALPDTLDLLAICIAAGLGFDQALAKTVKMTRGPLSDELMRVSVETATLGKDRRVVWDEAGDRIGVDEVSSFISAVIQSLDQGTSPKEVIQEQSDLLRQKRILTAEGAAQKAALKMMPPIAIFFLPALLATLLVPLVAPAILGGGF